MTKAKRAISSLAVLCSWMVLGCSSPTSPEPQLNGLWTLHLTESGINCWKLPLSGSGIYSGPAIGNNNMIYLTTDEGHLYAISPEGSIAWDLGLMESDVNTLGMPTIGDDGTIHLASVNGTVFAISPGGSIIWQKEFPNSIFGSPVLAADGTIIYACQDYYLRSLDPDDGSSTWTSNLDRANNASMAIGSDGSICIPAWNKFICADAIGQFLWDYTVGDRLTTSPAINADGSIIIGSDDFSMYCLSSSGELLWSYTTSGAIRGSPVIGRDGTVYFGSNDGWFYALGPEQTLSWKLALEMDESFRGAFVGADDKIYVTTTTAIMAIDENGQVSWRIELPGGINADSAVAPDGTIYAIALEGHVLYAIDSGCGGLADTPWPRFQYDSQNTGRRP